MRTCLARHLHTLATLSLAALLIGQLGTLHWFAELFSHFLPHYTLAFLLAAISQRGKKRLLWLACTLAASAWLILPVSSWTTAPPAAPRSLIWYNVHLDNPRADAESARLIAENADHIALAEINPADPGWQPLRTRYPHGCEHRDHSPFALALWSQQPLAACALHFIGGYPYIRAEQPDGTAIYALHSPPPITAQLAHARQNYLEQTAIRIARDPRAIIAGDLNLTPYSPHYRRFLRHSGTRAHTPNIRPTWKPFFLNIDHILTRNLPAAVRALPWQHSDHRPLRAEY